MRRSRLILAGTTATAALIVAMLPMRWATAAAPALQARTSDEQMVTVTVTPRVPVAGSWEFDVSFNTHVQPLGDDMMKAAALVDPAGAAHAPLAWRGDGPGGHHRKGVLVFAPLQPRPQSIELRIQRAGEPAPRSFAWELR